jgi:uncharacterized protein YbjT (DUF2867 family)
VVAAVGNPKAANRKLVLGGPNALSFRDAARIYGQVLGRDVTVQGVPPGQPIQGFPQVVLDLMAGLDMGESIVDMTALADEFRVTLTTVEDFARQQSSPPSA